MSLGILVVVLVIVSVAAYRWHAQRGKGATPSKGSSKRTAGRKTASRPRSRESATGSAATASTFAAVEIRVPSSACRSARELEGKSFFASEAPALPLAGCTEARCRCSFGKHSDRRQDKRRLMDDGIATTIFSAAEKRAGADRRDSDTPT